MLLTITLLCVILLLAAALGAGYAMFKHPRPLTIRAEIILPAPNVSKQIADAPAIDPIPEAILEYIDQESEEHARQTRRQRARSLRGELGSWEAAFRQLQREDSDT